MAFKETVSKVISTMDIKLADAMESSEWEKLTKKLEKGCNNEREFENLTVTFMSLCAGTQSYLASLEPILKASKVKTAMDMQNGNANPETDLTLQIMNYRKRSVSNLLKAYELISKERKKFETLTSAMCLLIAGQTLESIQTIDDLNRMLEDPQFKDLEALKDPYNAALLEQFKVKLQKLAEKENKGMAKFETFVAEKEEEKGSEPGNQ